MTDNNYTVIHSSRAEEILNSYVLTNSLDSNLLFKLFDSLYQEEAAPAMYHIYGEVKENFQPNFTFYNLPAPECSPVYFINIKTKNPHLISRMYFFISSEDELISDIKRIGKLLVLA